MALLKTIELPDSDELFKMGDYVFCSDGITVTDTKSNVSTTFTSEGIRFEKKEERKSYMDKKLEDLTMDEIVEKMNDGKMTFGEIERVMTIFNIAKTFADLNAKKEEIEEEFDDEDFDTDEEEETENELEEKLKKLIGYKLIAIHKDMIEVSKDGISHFIHIKQDEGDCCGYNELNTELYLSSNCYPIITNVSCEKKVEPFDCETCKITFYGLDNKLASIESTSGSGSGYAYGACVTIKCDALELNDILSSW